MNMKLVYIDYIISDVQPYQSTVKYRLSEAVSMQNTRNAITNAAICWQVWSNSYPLLLYLVGNNNAIDNLHL